MIPRLSIVIPSHNRPDLLRACLGSVLRHMPSDTEVVVVDDASPDGTVGAAAREFAGVRIERLERRGGFCIAANTGLRASCGEIVELLNDDTEVCAGWADAALETFADPRVGAVAPLVLRWPGGPPGQATIDSAGDRYYLGGVAGKHGHGEVLRPDHLRPRFVFGASASSAFYRREALLMAGAFPESFGAYFEDVDLSFRLHWASYRVFFEPRSRVLHHVSASYGARPDASLLEQQSRNEELVFWRNVPGGALLRALPLHLAVVAAKAWRRWRCGELLPFLRGRFQALRQLTALRAHRRQLYRLGRPAAPEEWLVDCAYQAEPV
jgi:GT2 family glycosyltransferase